MESNGWITDKEPDGISAGDQMVWVWERYKSQEYAALRDYTDVELGTPWQPIIKPPPYVKPSIIESSPYVEPRWKPKEGEQYFVCSVNYVIIRCWDDDDYDHTCYERGNCFETEEEAEEVFDKITQLLKEHHDGK